MTQYPYHINPETGRPNKCYKVDNCRFGIPADQHYATREEAVAARDGGKVTVGTTATSTTSSQSTAAQGAAETTTDSNVLTEQAPTAKVKTGKKASGESNVRTPQDEAEQHDEQLAQWFAERNEQRSFAVGNVRTLAHRLGINLKKRRLDPERVIARAEAAVNDPNKPVTLDPYLSWAQENLAKMSELQSKIDNADRSYAGWARYYRVPGGRIHTSVDCRTCNHSWEHPTEFEWLYDLSGKTEKDAVDAYGPVLCTVCYPDAPMEWTDYFERAAEEKKKTHCPGSGTWDYNLETARLGHATGNWGICEHCEQKVSITSTGKLRSHRKPANLENETAPSDPSSGAAIGGDVDETMTDEVEDDLVAEEPVAPKPRKAREKVTKESVAAAKAKAAKDDEKPGKRGRRGRPRKETVDA